MSDTSHRSDAGTVCFRNRKSSEMGAFLFLPQLVPTPQNHCHLYLGLIIQWKNVAWLVSVQWWGDDRQVSQSGKPLCTGASLWDVPKLARGLCPLEPRHANGGNSVLEISTGYFFSDCHRSAKTLSCIYQRGTLHIPLWNPLLI